ncbi:Actin- protein 2/3 complex subunit 4 [Blastosporella zonata]|nr:Actin- protein 2/3 complex subunit 4 [Blastosporella zonata]
MNAPQYADRIHRGSKEVLLNPLTISRNENERVLIEPSVNSIRLSIRIKQSDEIERILCHKFTRFMMQRAENFIVLRRKPVPHSKGYDISFLITNTHSETMLKHKIVDFIIQFMEEVDKELSGMKLNLNWRARTVAESYLAAEELPIPTLPTYAPTPSIDPTLVIRAVLVVPAPDLDVSLWNKGIEERKRV